MRKTTRLNLVDQRFGRLIVVAHTGNDAGGRVQWLCRCDCGSEHRTTTSLLRTGQTRSCGCLRSQATRKRRLDSGRPKRANIAWCRMLRQCKHPLGKKVPQSKSFTKRWLSYHAFVADMGLPPDGKYMLRRYNPEKMYCKQNCYWDTPFSSVTLPIQQ